MANDLAVIEAQFRPLVPRMDALVPAGAGIGGERIVQSIMLACEKTPKLLSCTRLSLQQAAFSACALGLLVDGVSGQGYIIPYGDVAQFQIGVKGYTTIAGRSRFMLGGDVIYAGEKYDIRLGTSGYVHHTPDFAKRGNGNDQAKIIAAYATLESNFAPPLVLAIGLDEILAVRNRSPGAKKADSPWNNFFGQMAIKTAKKRLAKSCPLDVLQLAGSLDDAADMGRTAYIRPEDRALIVDHEAQPLSPMQPQPDRPFTVDDTKFGIIDATDLFRDLGSLDNWQRIIGERVLTLQSDEQIEAFMERNKGVFVEIGRKHPHAIDDIRLRLAERIDEIRKMAEPA